MKRQVMKGIGLLCTYAALIAITPDEARADLKMQEYRTTTKMEIQIDDAGSRIYAAPEDSAEVIGTAEAGNVYTVLENIDDQWMKISVDDMTGYLNTKESEVTVAETAEEVVVDLSAERRQEIVNYALQFVGGRYRYGGTNPNNGVDCSGFTAYVMQNAANITLAHSSRTQSTQGRVISLAEARPGDLIFFGSGKYINHVAMYIGDGQIVHAANARKGIRTDSLQYRNPIKVVNVLGD